MLGEAGATVYCTGRSTRENRTAPREGDWERAFGLSSRPETIGETAELVNAHGGKGIAVRVDHTRPEEVKALLERITTDSGRLDLLVNDVWGGDELSEWGKPFWELSLSKGLALLERALGSHLVTARLAAPLMVAQRSGLIVESTDGDSLAYRGTLRRALRASRNCVPRPWPRRGTRLRVCREPRRSLRCPAGARPRRR